MTTGLFVYVGLSGRFLHSLLDRVFIMLDIFIGARSQTDRSGRVRIVPFLEAMTILPGFAPCSDSG